MNGGDSGRTDDDRQSDNGGGEHSGSYDYGGGRRAKEKEDSERHRIGPLSPGSAGQVERLREAVIRANSGDDWRDWPIIAGAILLAICVVATLILAMSINSRANKVIANQTQGARQGGIIVERIEGKIDTLLGNCQ